MTATIVVDGVDRSSSLVRLEVREEYCDPGKHFEAIFDQFFLVSPWESVTISYDATLVFTGNVSQIESSRPSGTMLVRGTDDIRRLREYFVAEDYETAGEGIKHWIRFFAEEAGCTVTFTEDYDPIPLHGMTLGRMFAIEIIEEFLLYAGWDIWCDENNVVNVGVRMSDTSPTEAIAAGDNLVSMERSEDSEPPRNAAIVYAAMGSARIHRTFGWEIDSNDVRTMVVASQYIQNPAEAADLASRMVTVAGPTYDIKRCDTDEVDPDIKVGDLATFDDGDGESGQDWVTSITTIHDGSSGEKSSHIRLGDRCAKVGAGGLPIDGRDVIVATYESGVWRCYDIWAPGGPVWYPLNTGLTDDYGPGYGSTYSCDWFIRDPYNPNGLAYLLTEAGILETNSLETGYESWLPTLMNYQVGQEYGDVPFSNWTIRKIRSTIASQGQYYLVVAQEDEDRTYVGITKDNFATFWGGPTPWGNYDEAWHPPVSCKTYSPPIKHSGLWGDCDYGNQKASNVPSWHHSHSYVAADGSGGLAAWHRNAIGCTVSGIYSCNSSAGGPGMWNCGVASGDIHPVQLHSPSVSEPVHPFVCLGIGNPLSPYECYRRPTITDEFTAGGPTDWLKVPTIHIPYHGQSAGEPSIMYFTPGWYAGNAQSTTDAWPILWVNGSHMKLELPWGSAYSLCHRKQGSIGTYTMNRNKVACWSFSSPSRFAISNDGGFNWEEKDSVPFATGCFSGFPTSASKVYCGRDAKQDPSGSGDESLIYVSWDRGETWHDMTGDLWDKTAALGLRGGGLGARGLVTIAPRYV